MRAKKTSYKKTPISFLAVLFLFSLFSSAYAAETTIKEKV